MATTGAFTPAQDMRTLRRVLKNCEVGTGEISKAIESCTFPLSERGVTMLQVSCRRSGRWRKALEIFETIKGERMRVRGVRPNFYTYSSLISVLCASGACSQALEILKEMREAGECDPSLMPDAEVYDGLIGVCHRRQRYKDVLQLYESLCREELLPAPRKALVCVMEACAELQKWEVVFHVLDDLAAMEADVPLCSYAKLLFCALEQKGFNNAVEVFLAMQMSEVVPDQMACHYMVRATAELSDPVTCIELVRSMQDAGMDLSPLTYACVQELLQRNDLPANTVLAKEAQ